MATPTRPVSEASARDGSPLADAGRDLTRSPAQVWTSVVAGRGRGIAGTVYGTVLVMATLVAAVPEHAGWGLTAAVAGASLAIWIAHVYANELGVSIERQERLTWRALKQVASKQLSMLAAATLPTLILALGAVGLLEKRTAVWAVLVLGLVTLGIQGFRYSRIEAMGTSATLAVIAANLALGGMIVAIKVIAAE